MKDNIIFKIRYIIIAVIIISYIIACDFMMTFSLVMNMYFIFAAILLILYNFTLLKPIKKEDRQPSFRYIFIKTLTIFFFVGTFSILLFNIFYPKTTLSEDKTYDFIIVFGAGINKEKNHIINSRLETALAYSSAYPRCKFVLTGSKGNQEPIEEAFYMRNYMQVRGVSSFRIIVDPYSVNTNENIENSLKLIKNEERYRNNKDLIIGLMSSDFHLTRISLMAKKIGISEPIVISCKTIPVFMPYLYIRENISLFKAFVLGQLKL